jgi:hypothetical protein
MILGLDVYEALEVLTLRGSEELVETDFCIGHGRSTVVDAALDDGTTVKTP